MSAVSFWAMELKLRGYCVYYVLFVVSFLTLQCFVTPILRRSASSNTADGLVIRLSSSDIVTRPTFTEQQTRSFIECAVLCIQTKACFSVYFENSSHQCFLNDDFLPGYVLRSGYTPSAAVDLFGWDPRGLVNIFVTCVCTLFAAVSLQFTLRFIHSCPTKTHYVSDVLSFGISADV